MVSPSDSPRLPRKQGDAEYFPSLPSHPDFIGPTAYAEYLASSRIVVPESVASDDSDDGEPSSIGASPAAQGHIPSDVSVEDNTHIAPHEQEVYLPILQYEINAAYVDLFANNYNAAPCLEDSFRYTIPTIVLGYMRRKYDAVRAATGLIQKVVESAISWRKDEPTLGMESSAGEEVSGYGYAHEESELAKGRAPSTRTTSATGKKHWSSKDPLGALEYMFDLIVRIATHFSWAAAKGEAGHQMLVELIVRSKDALERICSDEQQKRDKKIGVKVGWIEEVRDAFPRTLVTVLNRHWIVRMPAESVVPHEETVNFASFLSFLVFRLPCPRSTAYSKMFLPSGQLGDFSAIRNRCSNIKDFSPCEIDLLYTLMKHDLESFYTAKLVKTKNSTVDFKLAMICAMYLMLAGERLWEYYVLNGRESDWAEGSDVASTNLKDLSNHNKTKKTPTLNRAAQELGKAHWHNWMSAMYSISHDEDADFLVRGGAVQAVRNMGHLVTVFIQRQELERREIEAEKKVEASTEIEAAAEAAAEEEVEAAFARKLKIKK